MVFNISFKHPSLIGNKNHLIPFAVPTQNIFAFKQQFIFKKTLKINCCLKANMFFVGTAKGMRWFLLPIKDGCLKEILKTILIQKLHTIQPKEFLTQQIF